MYFVRTPNIIIKLFSGIIWELPNKENKIYLTFDDGPHPEITPWILQQLKKSESKATFFCLGQNAEKYPEIVQQILKEGHAIGNHGYEHLDGWKTRNEVYLKDIQKAAGFINSKLFRPPYGRIKKSQILNLKSQISILNWSLMPGDFDQNIPSEKCYQNVIKKVRGGDIICLHDNEKARKHLEYCLPKWLEDLKKWKFEKIS